MLFVADVPPHNSCQQGRHRQDTLQSASPTVLSSSIVAEGQPHQPISSNSAVTTQFEPISVATEIL